MSASVDPVPREARSFQGHRAGLVTRTRRRGDRCRRRHPCVGCVLLRVFAFSILLDPRNFTAPRPSPALVYAVGALLLIFFCGELDG